MNSNNIEIERKWLIDVASLPFRPTDYPCKKIVQGYIGKTSDGKVIRVRRVDENFFICIKGRGTVSKMEVEVPITKDQFKSLVTSAGGTIIKKNRHLIPHGNRMVELDLFLESFSGFSVAEVEFPTVDEAMSYTPPVWFGREVTCVRGYSNYSISRYGRPVLVSVEGALARGGGNKVSTGIEIARMVADTGKILHFVMDQDVDTLDFWIGVFIIAKTKYNGKIVDYVVLDTPHGRVNADFIKARELESSSWKEAGSSGSEAVHLSNGPEVDLPK